MNVTRDKTENSQVFLTITVEPPELEVALEKSYRHLVGRTNVPGFRRGKAPRAIFERFVGRKSLLDEALNTLVPEAYERAIKEQQIEAIAQPQIEMVQTEPVVFRAVVPLRPTVELGDYRSIRATPEAVTVADKDVDAVIEDLRHQHATWEPVERPVEFGDLATLDIESRIDSQPLINRKGNEFQVLKELTFPAPGFSEQLIGMKVGEEREFKLGFPADYQRSEMAGKEASFKVKVTEVKQEKLPELNDEFATLVNPEFKSLESLRTQVSASLKLRAESRAKFDFEEQIIDAAVNLAKVEFPPVLVEVEMDRLLEQQLQRLQGVGLDEYLRNVNKTKEDLREELRPVATKRVTSSLVLDKIAETEKIEVSDAEIDAEISGIAQSVEEAKREDLGKALNAQRSREAIKDSLVRRKTVERLAEVAGGPKEEAG